jgi:hypothetical protein
LDIRQYPALKAAGVVTLAKLKNAYSITLLKFSPDLGTPVDPVTETIDLAQLQTYANDIQTMKEALALLITDLKAIP